MCQCRKNHRPQIRRGLTLAELLISIAILGLLSGGLATLALTVGSASDLSHRQWLVTQHARVAIERIERSVAKAYANEQFPGCIHVGQQRGSWDFPDTLVVWNPAGNPASPNGLPLFREVTIFTPDHDNPSRLLEITLPYDSRPVPAVSDTSSWQNEIADAKSDLTGADVVQLTDMLRAETLSEYPAAPPLGAVRFEVLVRPSMAAWNDYQGGTTAWQDLPWAQDIRGISTGLRQTWCRFEVQLTDNRATPAPATSTDTIYAFFGSAAIFYELHK